MFCLCCCDDDDEDEDGESSPLVKASSRARPKRIAPPSIAPGTTLGLRALRMLPPGEPNWKKRSDIFVSHPFVGVGYFFDPSCLLVLRLSPYMTEPIYDPSALGADEKSLAFVLFVAHHV